MPEKTICPDTGAIIYSRTPEEQKVADLEDKVAELTKLVMQSNKNTKK